MKDYVYQHLLVIVRYILGRSTFPDFGYVLFPDASLLCTLADYYSFSVFLRIVLSVPLLVVELLLGSPKSLMIKQIEIQCLWPELCL